MTAEAMTTESAVPCEQAFDSTLALLADPYGFIASRPALPRSRLVIGNVRVTGG